MEIGKTQGLWRPSLCLHPQSHRPPLGGGGIHPAGHLTVSHEERGQADSHNEGVLTQTPPFIKGSLSVLVRALCNGKTSAFQADDAGSIPAARLIKVAGLRLRLGPQAAQNSGFAWGC